MRALHLFFRLHRPFELKTPDDFEQGYFGGEAEFREAERTEYQPFFALIERNTQRYKELKVTLAVTGPWLEQAEKWSPELIRRIRRLANLGQVEVVAEPYGHSLASFYDKAEFAAQVEQYQQQALKLLNVECRTLCLPELIYHDKLAKWAAEAGFKTVLAGDADEILKHRSANYPYFAAGSEELTVLFQNSALSRALRRGEHSVMTEEFEEVTETEMASGSLNETPEDPAAVSVEDFVRGMAGKAKSERRTTQKTAKTGFQTTGKWLFSAKKLQKQLDLACLRGNLVNLYLDTGIFREFREAGIVAMFDEFFLGWLKVPGNRFVIARETPELKLTRPAVSVKTTVNWRGELPRKAEEGLAVLKDVRYCPPEWLRERKQVRLEQDLYSQRAGVLSSNDEKLKRDFWRLTALDYLLLFNAEVPALVGTKRTKLEATLPESFEAALVDLRARTPILKLAEHNDETAGSVEDEKPEVPHGKYLPEEDHTVVVHRVKRTAPVEVAEKMVVEEPLDEATEATEEVADDDFEMDEWQEAMSSAADDVEAELQIMMQRMSRAKGQAARELDELEEAEVVEAEPEEAERTEKTKRARKKLVIE